MRKRAIATFASLMMPLGIAATLTGTAEAHTGAHVVFNGTHEVSLLLPPLCKSIFSASGGDNSPIMDNHSISSVGIFNDPNCLTEVDRLGPNSVSNPLDGSQYFRMST